MDAALFISHFPEFATAPEAQIAFWSEQAERLLPVKIWGTSREFGVELFTAHQLTLALGNARAATVGGIPGGQQGGVTAKGVDKVSVSYDVGSVGELNGGHWNESSYGRQFLRLARNVGAGGRQL